METSSEVVLPFATGNNWIREIIQDLKTGIFAMKRLFGSWDSSNLLDYRPYSFLSQSKGKNQLADQESLGHKSQETWVIRSHSCSLGNLCVISLPTARMLSAHPTSCIHTTNPAHESSSFPDKPFGDPQTHDCASLSSWSGCDHIKP
jgi:hypothetical protein